MRRDERRGGGETTMIRDKAGMNEGCFLFLVVCDECSGRAHKEKLRVISHRPRRKKSSPLLLLLSVTGVRPFRPPPSLNLNFSTMMGEGAGFRIQTNRLSFEKISYLEEGASTRKKWSLNELLINIPRSVVNYIIITVCGIDRT